MKRACAISMFACGAFALVQACAAPPRSSAAVARSADDPVIVQIALPMSNAYLIRSTRPILIDAGGPKDADAIQRALIAADVKPKDLALILLTHAHADHGGAAAALHNVTGAPIALGAPDVAMAASGHNGPLRAVGLEAWLVRPFVNPPFTPYSVDIPVEQELDLAPWGIAGRAVLTPGHTPGSIVVLLDSHDAFVGDLLRGGSMGGRLSPHTPHDHYFQPDVAVAHAHICALLVRGVERFHVGHGGPLTRDAVARAFPCRGEQRNP